MKLELVGDKIGRDEYREDLIDLYVELFTENFKSLLSKRMKDNFIVRY